MKAYSSVPRAIVVLASAALLACLDFTPITVAPSDAGTVVDASGFTIDAGACKSCLEGTQCSSDLQVCASTPKCEVMFECGASKGCYEPGANLVGCLTICGQLAGVTGSTDPAIGPFLLLYECLTGDAGDAQECAATCGGP